MKIAEYVGNNIVILEPTGRLTAETVHVFKAAVSKRLYTGWHKLIVDLHHIDYIDSAGLGALVQAYTSGQLRGARLVMVHVFGRNKELLKITKLTTVFEVYETTIEAERSLTRPSSESAVM